MRRYIKPILLRIPAVRRYLDEKRAIAAALEEAKAQSDRLGDELASLRGTAEALAAERNTLRGQAEQLRAAAESLGAARDAALDQIERLQSEKTIERDGLVQQINDAELKINALSLDRDAALERAAQTKAAAESLAAERDVLSAEVRQLRQREDSLAVPLPQTVEVDISPNVASSACSFTFDQLLNRDYREHKMIFQIHVPKTAGTTVSQLFRQNGYWQLTLDDISNDFFSVVDEQRWLARAARDSHFFSGHFLLDHSIFRRIPGPHTIVTTLRHPIQRMLSYYNFSGRNPVMAYHADIAAGRMSVVDYAEFILSASGPQYCYFDDSGEGGYVHSGSASPRECLENLFTRVSFFGLTERFSEFATILGYLFDLDNVLVVNSGKVTSEMKNPEGAPLKRDLTPDESARLTALLRDDLWFYTLASQEYERRISDPKLQDILARLSALREPCANAMTQVRAIFSFNKASI